MTEIPEHLLKRSRERRAAVTGSDDAASDDAASDAGDQAAGTSVAATTSSAPAAAAPSGPPERAAAPATSAPEPPKPDLPVVAAYKSRKKIPFWAMTAMALLPVWAFMYARAVTTQAQEATGPLAEGAVIYGNCASCHGGAGQGVASLGYQFSEGEVLKTFPNIEDQLRFVYWGTAEYALAEVEVPGDPDREGGPHVTGAQGVMPAQGSEAGGALEEDFEVLAVVCHERYTLGGAAEMEEYDAEFEQWCSEESPLYSALEGGETLAALVEVDDTIIPIGDGPAPATPRADSANAGQPEQG